MTTWCTTADVLTYTNVEVDDTVLAQAGALIDVHTARPYDVFVAGVPDGQVCKISATDLYWLKLACAYQAAWLSTQPDAFTRSDLLAVGRGKANVTFTDTGMVLAPLAKHALRRVSFLKSRSLHVPGPMELDRWWVGGTEDGSPGWQDLGPVS